MVHPNYYDMVGLKSEAEELSDAQTQIGRLRGLLRQVSDGLLGPNEAERWVYLGENEGEDAVCYSLMLVGWLAVVGEELGKEPT